MKRISTPERLRAAIDRLHAEAVEAVKAEASTRPHREQPAYRALQRDLAREHREGLKALRELRTVATRAVRALGQAVQELDRQAVR